MLVERRKERTALEEMYEGTKFPFVVLYGRYGIGKTWLMKDFAEDKTHVYYLGREYAKDEQKRHLQPVFDAVRTEAESLQEGRVCLFVDEFDQIWRAYKDFFEDLSEFLQEDIIQKRVMVILASSSVQWVEQEMVKTMGVLARQISTFIKLKEFSFLETLSYFPDSTTEECIAILGTLGGVPRYFEYWEKGQSVKDNIIRLFLTEQSPLRYEAEHFLKRELRELSVYNTILTVLAEDQNKLNYLYNRTGFSRAKISVYIKNLIALDVAHKIFSFEIEKRENIQKGLYGISDSLIYFWYKFIYPNLSALSWEEPDVFYDTYIKPGLDEYMRFSFTRVCREYLELMNQFDRLPLKVENIGSLYGKDGFIPLIAKGMEGEVLVGTCKWSREPMTVEEFHELLHRMEQTGKEADYYYLFSREGFTQELEVMTSGMENIKRIDIDNL